MISVKNLKKNYGSLEVINNTTLELPKKGLIAFLGESGSGKTSLVNVIGGLDSFKSGSVSYSDEIFSKYKMDKIDAYRRNHFGYIFQNYNILEDKTVTENLLLALHIIGIYDHDECNKRIKNALEAVGLYKFRKKLAGALSGGQMQRVSIARALIKHNDVIIADEPTGNLDTETTRQIIRILKKISINSLVILVTHDKELASTYADAIYHIKDGKVSEYQELSNEIVTENRGLNDVYLGDLSDDEVSGHTCKIKIHKESDALFDIEVFEHNGVYYLKSTCPIKLDYQNLRIHEGKYETKQVKSEDFAYHDDDYQNITSSPKGKFWGNLKEEIILFYRGKLRSRVFKLAFVLIGVVFMILNVLFITNSDDFEKRNSLDSNVYNIDIKYNENLDTFYYQVADALDKGYISNVCNSKGYISNITLSFNLLAYKNVNLEAICYEIPLFHDELYKGRKPQNDREIIVSTAVAQKILKASDDNSYDDVLNLSINCNSTSVGMYNSNTTIVGIYKDDRERIYTGLRDFSNDDMTYYSLKEWKDTYITPYKKYGNPDKGNLPTKNTEVMISSLLSSNLDKGIGDKLSNGDTICGIYNNEKDNMVYCSDTRYIISINDSFRCNVNDLDSLKEYSTFSTENDYDIGYNNYKDDYNSSKKVFLTIEIILLAICALYTYFTMKSRMLSDIYEIGVCRELGQKRSSLVLKYVLRSTITVTLTMMIGYIVSTVVYGYIAIKLNNLGGKIALVHNSASTYYSILLIYAVGIFFGILPIVGLLRKTPAQIVSKYDI